MEKSKNTNIIENTEITTGKLIDFISELMDEKKAKDIKILNIAEISTIGDYFIICSADSSTQVRAITEYIKFKMKEEFEIMPAGCEEDKKGRWNLLDYQDIVVHVMHHQDRAFYNLEKFWDLAKTKSANQF